MTPKRGVTDDQLGQYVRRCAAIADRLGKSLPFEAVMRALQDILEGSSPILDMNVCVNRSVRPPYPDWARVVMHPELEGTGPAEYNLQRDVELWLHPEQRNGVVSGNAIYASLKEDNTLADQLGLTDLLAIQKKGIAVFRALFKDNVVFGWKSVVQNRNGHLHVPYLYEDGDDVVLYWNWLGNDWRSNVPAARFRKKS